MSTSSLPKGDAQTSAFYGDCTPAQDCEAVIEKSDSTVRQSWESLRKPGNLEQDNLQNIAVPDMIREL